MALVWKCDICNKDTYINPPTEPDIEFKEVEVKLQDKTETIKQPIQKKAKMKRQNIYTGDIEEIEIPLMKDLKPRTIIINLKAGAETIQKDFCMDCYQKHVSKEVSKLWKKLEGIKSK